MRTIILEEPGRFVRADTPEPSALASGHALVRIHRVGVCGTDLHAFRGRQPYFVYPRILGHELGVEVLDVVSDSEGAVRPGDHCAVEPYLNCGQCDACRRGRGNCCEHMQVLGVHVDGGMREVISVPAHKLHRSSQLSLDQLALVETLGIGAHAVDRGGVSSEDTVLVIGAGPIGLGVVEFAHLIGAQVVVLDLDAGRREFCHAQFGVEHCIDGGDDPVEAVRTVLNGRLPTVVFDATGSPASMMNSFQFVAHGGRLVFVGIVLGKIEYDSPQFHGREITLFATRNALPKDFTRIIELMEAGRIDTRPWITHRAGYDDFAERFPDWLDPANGVVKALLAL